MRGNRRTRRACWVAHSEGGQRDSAFWWAVRSPSIVINMFVSVIDFVVFIVCWIFDENLKFFNVQMLTLKTWVTLFRSNACVSCLRVKERGWQLLGYGRSIPGRRRKAARFSKLNSTVVNFSLAQTCCEIIRNCFCFALFGSCSSASFIPDDLANHETLCHAKFSNL